MRVEEIEGQIARRSRRLRQRSRRRRLLWTVLLGVPMGAGVGFTVGYSTRTTPEELMHSMEAESSPESALSEEINRALLELWRMEDLEFARNRQGR